MRYIGMYNDPLRISTDKVQKLGVGNRWRIVV